MMAVFASAWLISVATAGSGANEPIDPNELGLTATDCAAQYCTTKDALMLWFLMENICLSDAQPYVINFAAKDAEDFDFGAVWSPATVGTLSALFGVVGLMVGYSAGGKYARTDTDRYYPVA